MALAVSRSLTALDLSGNSLTSADAAALAAGLAQSTVLRELDVSSNRLEDAGGQALGHCLLQNADLEVLRAAACQLGFRAAVVFASALKSNDTLRELDLSGNSLTQPGIAALLEALVHRPRDTELNLQRCPLDVAPRGSFDLTRPLGAYSLRLEDPYERAVLLALVDVVANHPEFSVVDAVARTGPTVTKLVVGSEDAAEAPTSDEQRAAAAAAVFDSLCDGLLPRDRLEDALQQLPFPVCLDDARLLLYRSNDGLRRPEFVHVALQSWDEVVEWRRGALYRGDGPLWLMPDAGVVDVEVMRVPAPARSRRRHPSPAGLARLAAQVRQHEHRALDVLRLAEHMLRLTSAGAVALLSGVAHGAAKRGLLRRTLPRMVSPAHVLGAAHALLQPRDRERLLRELGAQALPLLGQATARYELDLSRPEDRRTLRLLQAQAREERLAAEGADVSQRGDRSCWRGATLSGQALDEAALDLDALPRYGVLRGDFATTRPLPRFEEPLADGQLLGLAHSLRIPLTLPDAVEEPPYPLAPRDAPAGILDPDRGHGAAFAFERMVGRQKAAEKRMAEIMAAQLEATKSAEATPDEASMRRRLSVTETETEAEEDVEEEEEELSELAKAQRALAEHRRQRDLRREERARKAARKQFAEEAEERAREEEERRLAVEQAARERVEREREQRRLEEQRRREEADEQARQRRVAKKQQKREAAMSALSLKARAALAVVSAGGEAEAEAEVDEQEQDAEDDALVRAVLAPDVIPFALQDVSNPLARDKAEGAEEEPMDSLVLTAKLNLYVLRAAARFRKAVQVARTGPHMLRELTVAFATRALSCRQLAALVRCWPRPALRQRVALFVALFPRLTDPRRAGYALRFLLPAEQAEAVRRLGWLRLWSPLEPAGRYELDLAQPDHRWLAKCLVVLAMGERGKCWHDQGFAYDPARPFAGWELPVSWFKEATMPDRGFLSVRFASRAPSSDLRAALANLVWGGSNRAPGLQARMKEMGLGLVLRRS